MTHYAPLTGNVSDADGNTDNDGSPHGRKRAKVGNEGRALRREGTVKNEDGSKGRPSRSHSNRQNREDDASLDPEDEGDPDQTADQDDFPSQPKIQTQPRDTDG